MDKILAQVARVRRHLWWELVLNRTLRCTFVTTCVAVVAMAVPKFVAISDLPAAWTWWCGAAGLGAGILAAFVWTWWDSLSALDAAVEIDRRFELRERVSSSLALTPAEIDSPAGRALLADASRAVGRLEVLERFGYSCPRRRWLPVLTASAAFVLLSLLSNPEAQSSVDPHAAEHAREAQENVSKQLRERWEEKRKQASEKGLEKAEGLFKKLEQATEKMAHAKEADKRDTLIKLNDLAKELAERRDQLGGEKELRKNLSKLNDLNQGPADKMAKAMKEGNWQQAAAELDKLKKKIEAGELDEETKQALMQQLKELQEKLAETADAHQNKMKELAKQIEEQRKQGNLAEAGEMQQKLDQMKRQQQTMDKLSNMSSQMGQLQQAMKNGEAGKAAQAMNDMMEQMKDLEQQMAEGEMLSAALDQLQMAKDAMACSECNGMGCSMCQGNGMKFGEKPGSGMGPGHGYGPRPDEKNDVKFRDSRVRQNPGKGPAVLTGEADGPNIRGQVAESIKEEMAALETSSADPQAVEHLPKSRREHVEEYFNSLREGP